MTKDRSLEEYEKKRELDRTPEPRGDERTRGAPRDGLIFCVQKHLASHLHYDLRLEHRGVLLSWAVPKGPSLNPRDKRLAMSVEDHPLDYHDFEGVIPEGYGAGIVMLWDHGTWRPDEAMGDLDEAIARGELKFTLEGYKLKGSWVLVRTKGPSRGRSVGEGEASRSWLLIKHRDEWSGPVDITTFAPRSVKSQGDFADILAEEDPTVWQSHRPAKGGLAGEMIREIIERAAEIKLQRQRETPARKRGKVRA